MAENEKPVPGLKMTSELQVETVGFDKAIDLLLKVKKLLTDLHGQTKIALEIPSGQKGIGLASEVQTHIKAAQIVQNAAIEAGKHIVMVGKELSSAEANLNNILTKAANQGIAKGQIDQLKAADKQLEHNFRLRVRNGELKAEEIRKLGTERELKWAISELEAMHLAKQGRGTGARLKAAEKSLFLLREKNREELKGISLVEKRKVADRDRAEASRKLTREINTAHGEALKEEASRKEAHNRRTRVSEGLELPLASSEQLKKVQVRRQKANLGELERADAAHRPTASEIATYDKATLKLHARYSVLRQGQELTEAARLEELRFQEAIQKQIALLAKLEREQQRPAPGAPTAQQLRSQALQNGRLKMSAYTTQTLPDASTLRKWHPSLLSALAQGQTQRQLAAIGSGDTKTRQDAAAVLWTIKGIQEEAKAKRQARAAARKQEKAEEASAIEAREKRLADLRRARAQEINTAHGEALKEEAQRNKSFRDLANQAAQQRMQEAQQRQKDRRTAATQRARDEAEQAKKLAQEINTAHGEALKERDVRTGRALPENYKDLQQRQRVRQQKFSVVDTARAMDEKLIPTLKEVAKATNLVWLQEEKRYAGIRKRHGFDQKDEQGRLNAIRARIKELEAASKTEKGLSDLQKGRLKMSEFTTRSLPNLQGLAPVQLQALKQGQTSRYLAGEGAGDTAKAQDALHVLRNITREEERRAEIKRKEREAERKAAGTTAGGQKDAHQAAAAAYKKQVELAALRKASEVDVRKINSLAQVGLEIDAAKLRAKKAIGEQLHREARLEDELIAKLQRHKQVLARQAEDPQDRARINAMRRQDTRDRLFGDGGASTMVVQAGLMAGYQVLGGLQSLFSGAISSAIEFDAALKQLQAISAATRNEMVDLKTSLIEVAQGSKFSAAEVAQASVLLAQAGLSVNEIQHTMKAVIQLATASGSELKKSVDVMTSVLSVFDLSASQSEDVANKLTAALNRSKLDIDKMALGLQYAGNAAADAGINFDELVSGLSAMANAGIRSGSTLGTGLRQLFVDIQKPSQNFQEILTRLGITMSDVDIRAQGFEGVMRNLIDKGFTSAEAFKAFQIRSASAFAALSNNIDTFHQMQEAIQGTNAALEANQIQMESLAVQYDHLKSNLGILAAEGFKPLLLVIRDMTSGIAHMAESVDKSGTTLKVVFTAIGTVLTTMAIAAAGNALAGLVGLAGGLSRLIFWGTAAQTALKGLWSTIILIRSGFLASSIAAGTFSFSLLGAAAAAGRLVVALGPIAVGIYLASSAFGAFRKDTEKLKDSLDEAKTKLNSFVEAGDKNKQQIEGLDEAVTTLSERYGRLSRNSSELQTYVRSLAEQFKNQGVTLSELSGKSIPELINKLNELRDTLSAEYVLKIREEGSALEKVNALEIQTQYAKVKELRKGLLPTTTGPQTESTRGVMDALLAVRVLTNQQNRGILAPGASAGAYTHVGTLRRDLVNYQTVPDVRADKKLLAQVQSAIEILDYLDSIHSKQRAGLTIGRDTQARIRAETLISQRRGSGSSGFDLASEALIAQSENNERPGGFQNIPFLEEWIKRLGAKTKEVQEALKAIPASDLGDQQARQRELEELAKAKSRLEVQLQPLLEQQDKDRMATLKAQIDTLKAEEQAIKAELEGQLSPAIRDKKADDLANLVASRQALEGQLRSLEEKRAKVSEATRRQNAEKVQREMEMELRELSAKTNAGNAEAKKKLRQLLRDSGQLFDDTFQALASDRFEKLDTDLQRELKDQKAYGNAETGRLSDRLAVLELRGRGYSTDQRLFDDDSAYPAEMGTLSLRSRVAAKLQAAAAQRELLKSQQEAKRQRANLLGSSLPGLERERDDQAQTNLLLEMYRDQALAKQREQLRETQRRLATGEDLGPNYQEKVNAINEEAEKAVKALEKGQEALDKMQEKVEGYRRERQALLLSYAQENDQFDTLFSALKVGVEGATQAISDALGRIVSRTGDVKDAFEDMARGILAAMLKVLTNKIAEQFMNFLLDMVPSKFKPGSKTTTENANAGLKNTPGNSRNGGLIRKASGGFVPGQVARDSVPTLLMPGEYVLQKSAASALGEDFLNGLNRTTNATLRQGQERTKKAGSEEKTGGNNLVNVWVVTPDQQTGMSKDDIVVTVSDNIARGGSLRRLIKQVQVGA